MRAPFAFIDEQQTARLLTMAEVVETCKTVLVDIGCKHARLSIPSAMFLEGEQSVPTLFKAKGGYIPSLDACGFRIVGDVGHDGALGESHFCYLVDPRTAAPRALVAHTEIHRMRTAACGLLALRCLSASTAQTFALIGAGRIGRFFAAGFHEIFPGKRLIIASRSRESAIKLAEQARSVGGGAIEAMSVEEASAAADAILTLTSSVTPVLAPDALRPGITIVGMGEHHELPAALLRDADRFVVDDLGFASTLGSLAAWIKAGDVTESQAADRLDGTLGEILAGRAQGRRSDADKILAIVQGLAIADIGLAAVCLRRSLEHGADPKLASM